MYNYFLCCRCVYCKTTFSVMFESLLCCFSQQSKLNRWCMSWIHLNTQINSHALTRLDSNSGPERCDTFPSSFICSAKRSPLSWFSHFSSMFISWHCGCCCASSLFFFSWRMLSMIGAQIFLRRKLTWKRSERETERDKTSFAENIINENTEKRNTLASKAFIHTHTWYLTEKHQRQQQKSKMLRC